MFFLLDVTLQGDPTRFSCLLCLGDKAFALGLLCHVNERQPPSLASYCKRSLSGDSHAARKGKSADAKGKNHIGLKFKEASTNQPTRIRHAFWGIFLNVRLLGVLPRTRTQRFILEHYLSGRWNDQTDPFESSSRRKD